MNETAIVRLGMIAASRLGARLFRYNAGVGWAGKSIKKPDGTVIIQNARPFHGVVAGHSDTGGFVPVTITQDMVGQTFARAVYVEFKTGAGRLRPEQRQFIAMARQMGCLAGVARSDSDVVRVIAGELVD